MMKPMGQGCMPRLRSEHERLLAIADEADRVLVRRHHDPRLGGVLELSKQVVLPHLRTEHQGMLRLLEDTTGLEAQSLVEDMVVDQAVLRNAVLALGHFVATSRRHERALLALVAGLRQHVHLMERDVEPWLVRCLPREQVQGLDAAFTARPAVPLRRMAGAE